MTEEVEDDKQRRNTVNRRIEALELANQELTSRMDKLTKAIIESAHIMGWPKSILEGQGIKTFDKTKDRLSVR